MTGTADPGRRILGVDPGSIRTGLALSDPLHITCSPLEVITEAETQRLIERILQVAEAHDVTEIVVGLPVPLSGGTNAQLESVQRFAAELAHRTSILVTTWDERFTSKLAERGRKDRSPADAVAACHMLQSYLDAAHLRRTRNDTPPEASA
ncbi:MAG: Holliday junction resolvase RuvX [Thermoleophilia bacterium]|nr:Holliday junction resolvase RuvX [Thermoleophilia bacterium]